jgi:hypothetical protein
MGCKFSSAVHPHGPPIDDDQPISKGHFDVERVIGQGGFGKVRSYHPCDGEGSINVSELRPVSHMTVVAAACVGADRSASEVAAVFPWAWGSSVATARSPPPPSCAAHL